MMSNGKEGSPKVDEWLMPDDIREAHAWSINNEYLISQSKLCGCFYCLALFPPSHVREWIREKRGPASESSQRTALCPDCGVDSVLPDSRDTYILGEVFLKQMRDNWFGTPRRG